MTTTFSVKALLVGGLVDIVTTYGASIVAVFTAGFVLSARGVPASETHGYYEGPVSLAIGLLIGNGGALLGGVVAARIAKGRELLHGAGAVLPCMLLGGVLHATTKHTLVIPTWYHVLSYAMVIPAGVSGGYLGRERKRTLAAIRAAHRKDGA